MLETQIQRIIDEGIPVKLKVERQTMLFLAGILIALIIILKIVL